MSDQITCNIQKISESVSKLEGYYDSILSYREDLKYIKISESKSTSANELNKIIKNLQVNITYRLRIMEKMIIIIKSFETNMQEADKYPS